MAIDTKPSEERLREERIKEEELTRSILSKSEISILLDSYDDIFSDFDPRPFNVRSLSIDFLEEAKRAAVEKAGKLQIIFLIPKGVRSTESETIIRRRLREHFKKHTMLLRQELRKYTQFGSILTACGMSMLFIASGARYLYYDALWSTLILTILEPGGWFTCWYGLDHIFYGRKEKKPEIEFYEKMSQADITFSPY